MNRQQQITSDFDVEVAIIGAGPIGMLLATLLARKGIRTTLVEKRTKLPAYSMAIGITPPTLNILSHVDLAQCFADYGVPVRDVEIYDRSNYLGHLSFAGIVSPWPYILSIPQNKTMAFLKETVRAQDGLTLLEGWHFESCIQHQSGVTSTIINAETGAQQQLSSRFLVGCDGTKSRVRACLNMPRRAKKYRDSFVMGEFTDRSGLEDKTRLVFTEHGALESFPLPENRRRWITMLPEINPPNTEEYQIIWLIQRIQTLSGFSINPEDCSWISTFQPERALCRRYYENRVVLCGDAAHVMSPIGGQGMNTGFSDAELLAGTLYGILREGMPLQPALNTYNRLRKRDFRIAADRAAIGMWIGTRKGRTARLRSVLFRRCLERDGIQRMLANSYSMLNLPGRTAAGVQQLHPDKTTIRLDTAFESAANRREVNRRIFSVVAPRYALVTRLLSFGRDTSWKRLMINELPPFEKPVCADLACGNGDLTARLLQKYPAASITGIDQSAEMLATARKAIRSERVCFQEADMLHTGLKTASCDLITAGYALRNAPDLSQAVAEIVRTLKPGGHLAILDFSRSPHRAVAVIQYLLLWLWGGWWGLVFHGNPKIYGYIADSLMHFPDRHALRQLLTDHGLQPVQVRRGFFGMIEVLHLKNTETDSPC